MLGPGSASVGVMEMGGVVEGRAVVGGLEVIFVFEVDGDGDSSNEA